MTTEAQDMTLDEIKEAAKKLGEHKLSLASAATLSAEAKRQYDQVKERVEQEQGTSDIATLTERLDEVRRDTSKLVTKAEEAIRSIEP